MNRVLKVVFSRAKGMFVVVSELGRACTKGSLKSVLVAVPMALLTVGAHGAETDELTNYIKFGDPQNVTNASAGGAGTLAIGYSAKAESGAAVAVGKDTYANGFAVAVGAGAKANASNSVALGYNAVADYQNSVALGYGSTTSAANTVSVGSSGNKRKIVNVADGTADHDAATVGQTVDGLNAILGNGVTVSVNSSTGALSVALNGTGLGGTGKTTISEAIAVATNGIAFGREITSAYQASATGDTQFDSIAIGRLAKAHSESASNAIALGPNTRAYGSGAIAIGDSAIVASTDNDPQNTNIAQTAIAIGSNAKALKTYATTLGGYATASGESSIALGYSANASGIKSVALGAYSEASGDNVVSVGSSSLKRRIVNVADGENDHDAATVGQLNEQVTTLGSQIQALEDVQVDWANLSQSSSTVDVNAKNAIQAQARSAISLSPAANKPISVTETTPGSGQWLIDLTMANAISNADSGLVTGSQMYSELRPTNGTYVAISSDNTTAQNLVALDSKIAANNNTLTQNKANIQLDNIDNDGKAVVRNLAKESVQVIAGTNTSVTSGTVQNATTYKVDVLANGAIASSNEGLLNGGMLFTELRPANGNYIGPGNTTAANLALLDQALYGALNNATGINKSAWWGALGGSISSASAETDGPNNGDGFVTGKQIYSELRTDGNNNVINGTYISSNNTTGQNLMALDQQIKANENQTATNLANKANVDGTNLNSDYAANWGSALGTGAVVATDNKLVTGATMHNELRPTGGNYVSNANTTAQNLVALDTQVKINADNVDKLFAANLTDDQKGKWLTTLGQGQVVDGEKQFVDGDTIYHALENVKIATNQALDTKLDKTEFNQYKSDTTTRIDSVETEAKKHTTVSTSDSNVVLTQTTNDASLGGGQNYAIALNKNMALESTTYTTNGATSKIDGAGLVVGNTSIKDGVITTNEVTVGNSLKLDSSGKITGLTEGKVEAGSTEAVNGSQLYETQQMIGQNASNIQTLNQQINKTYDKVQRVGAGAAALAALRPQDFSPDHPISGAVGLGHYDGKQAFAVGMYYRPTENFTVGFGASAAGNDDYMMNAGISYRFGGSGSQLRISQSDINRKVVDLTDQNRALIAQIESSNIREEASAKRLNRVQKELKAAQKKAEVADQKLDMVMKELAALREEIQKMKQR